MILNIRSWSPKSKQYILPPSNVGFQVWSEPTYWFSGDTADKANFLNLSCGKLGDMVKFTTNKSTNLAYPSYKIWKVWSKSIEKDFVIVWHSECPCDLERARSAKSTLSPHKKDVYLQGCQNLHWKIEQGSVWKSVM